MKTKRVRGYKNLRGAVTKQKKVDIFEKKAAKFLVDDGRSLVGVGDDGVRTWKRSARGWKPRRLGRASR